MPVVSSHQLEHLHELFSVKADKGSWYISSLTVSYNHWCCAARYLLARHGLDWVNFYMMAPFAEVLIVPMSSISPVEVCKEPDLIDGWWTSHHLFTLERRAIFSKVHLLSVNMIKFLHA